LQVSPAWVCHGDVRVEQRLRPFVGLSLRHVRAAYIGRWTGGGLRLKTPTLRRVHTR
jgi:hypothetical protein